jgi:hypothetical protein
MRTLIVGMLLVAGMGCMKLSSGPTATTTAVASPLPTKPADQMSDAELIAAYREYEKEHAWVYANRIGGYILGSHHEKKREELPKYHASVAERIQVAKDRYKNILDAEAKYARSWANLNLKLLPGITFPEPLTLEQMLKSWDSMRRD